ncbi:MAG: hypothetical protein COB46_03515 [Rhodospirillaceae bacterium]|nr:MAG: hypothetical protein COB46_03515 [Rhodospirillaceae bacterium]
MHYNAGKEFLFPPWVTLSFYDGRKRLLFSTNKRDFDLSDNLMLDHPYNSRRIFLGIKTNSKSWNIWNEECVQKLEELIRYDLEFDGYRVQIKRMSKLGGKCVLEFLWRLQIREF